MQEPSHHADVDHGSTSCGSAADTPLPRARTPGGNLPGPAGPEHLHEALGRYRATFDLAPVGLAHVSPTGEFLRVNAALCALLGYAEAELVGRRFQELTHPADLTADLDHVVRCLGGHDDAYSLTKRYVRPDGTIVPAQLHARLVRAPSADGLLPGAPFYFIAVVEGLDPDGATRAADTAERAARGADHATAPCEATAAELARVLADAARLAAIERTGLVDQPTGSRQETLDRLTRVAARVLDVPGALVNLVTDAEQITVACWGADAGAAGDRVPVADAFCRIEVGTGHPFVVEDAREHPLVRDSVWTRERGLVAYAGVPVTGSDGQVIGSLCVFDTRPRRWSAQELAVLDDLATLATADLRWRTDARRRDVAEASRDAALRDLAASEQRLREMAESLESVFWLAEPDYGSLLYVNPAFARVYGRAVEDFLRDPVGTFLTALHPDDRDRVVAAAAAQPDGTYDIEYRVVHPDGAVRWVHDRAVPVRDAEGRVVRIAGVADDITARVQADQALRASEARYRAFVEASALGVWSTSADGVTIALSDAWGAFTGQAPSSLPGLGFADAMHADDRDAALSAWLDAVARADRGDSTVVYEHEYRLRRHDGVYRRVRARGVPVRDGTTGRVSEWVGTFTDVEEARRADAERAEAATRFRAVFERASVGMARVAFEGARWIEVNDALCRLVGYPREELLAVPWPTITHPDDVALDLEPFRRMAAGELEAYTVEKRFIHRDGHHVWARLHLSLVRDAAGRPDYEIAVIEDITEARHAAAARERSLAAERAARARVEALQRVSAALNAEREAAAIARVVHAAARELLGAHAGGVLVLDDEGRTFEVLHTANLPATLVATWQRFPNAPGLPAPDAVAAGAPLYFEARAALLATYGALADAVAEAGTQALAVLPLVVGAGADRRALGVLTLDFPHEHHFDADERALLEAIAAQTAQALDRARLFEREHAARLSLARERARLADVFEQAPAFLAVLRGPTHVVEQVNHAFYRVVGTRPLVGRTVAEALPAVATTVVPILDHVLATGESYVGTSLPLVVSRDVDAPPADGFVDIVLAPLVEADGSRSGVIAIGSDVTDRVYAERARTVAREAEDLERRRLQALLAALPVGVILGDAPDGRLVYLNEAVARIWGQTLPTARIEEYSLDWTGYHVDAAGRATTRRYASHEWPLARAITTGEVVRDELVEIERPDGTRARGLLSAAPIRDASGAIVGGVVTTTDVTEAARARDALDEARQAAEAANRAKSDFLASMSHELRTPLNAIQGHVQLLELEIHGPVTDRQREALGRVGRAGHHLLGLINDVLNYAKLEAGKVEYHITEVALTPLLDDLAAMMEPQFAMRDIAFRIEPPRDDAAWGTVWADAEKLRQVLLNLLSNAAKFTLAGGTVTLTMATDPTDSTRLGLQVRDTGIGIAADKIDAAFAPFVQVTSGHGPYTRTQEGTGLGLAISRDLARGMRGDLTATSVVGEGSTFTVHLQRARSATGARTDRRQARRGAGGGRRDGRERRSGEDRRGETDTDDTSHAE